MRVLVVSFPNRHCFRMRQFLPFYKHYVCWQGRIQEVGLGEGSGEGAVPLPRNFFEFLSRNGAFFVDSANDGGHGSWNPGSALVCRQRVDVDRWLLWFKAVRLIVYEYYCCCFTELNFYTAVFIIFHHHYHHFYFRRYSRVLFMRV